MYVHTFNTESGLIRKVDALGLSTWRCMLESEEPKGVAQPHQGRDLASKRSPSDAEAAACKACVAVLPFLLDGEKSLGNPVGWTGG